MPDHLTGTRGTALTDARGKTYLVWHGPFETRPVGQRMEEDIHGAMERAVHCLFAPNEMCRLFVPTRPALHAAEMRALAAVQAAIHSNETLQNFAT